jgi:bifunctional DNA-binding transcriptional regulator/antitoxin component of YhaV-PrlF toxin-antitoxin module
MQILKTTKIYNSRLYLPKEILELLKAKDGDVIIFGLDEHHNITIFKNEEEKKSTRFNIISTD